MLKNSRELFFYIIECYKDYGDNKMPKARQTKRESIVNRVALKKFILKTAEADRPGWDCQRVSAVALDQIEAFLRAKIKDSVHRQPSIGKTYMNFY